MFEQKNYLAVQEAAQIASQSGEDVAVSGFDRLKEEALKRKILQADVVAIANTISPRQLVYLALNSGMMEGFYIVDMGRELAWRWITDDEGETPFVCNPPSTTPSGTRMTCGTCQHSEAVMTSIGVRCTVHKQAVTVRHTCRDWIIDPIKTGTQD